MMWSSLRMTGHSRCGGRAYKPGQVPEQYRDTRGMDDNREGDQDARAEDY